MNDCDRERFSDLFFKKIAPRYPNAKVTKIHEQAYWESLQRFRFEAVELGFNEAVRQSPEFMPPEPMVGQCTARVTAEFREESAQLRFESYKPETSSQDAAMQEFYKLCDLCLSRPDDKIGDKKAENNRHVVWGLMITLGAFYGIDRDRMTKHAKPLAAFWGAQRRWSLHMVARGLRQVPVMFKRFPTPGMIESLILGERVGPVEAGWLNDDVEDGAGELPPRWKQEDESAPVRAGDVAKERVQ